MIMIDFFGGKKRHIFRIIIALAGAFFINEWGSFTAQWWLPLATFFVMLTSTGSAIYQGVLRYILLLLVVGLSSWFFASAEVMYVRSYDITIGACIGILVNAVVLPDRIAVDFRKVVVPILQSYASYYAAIVNLLLQRDRAIEEKKLAVEVALQKLPVWVYETGFDLALQKGYRFFVMKVNEVGELLFAMHHLARYPFPQEVRVVVEDELLLSVQKAEQFFKALIEVLNLKLVTGELADFYQEIDRVEQAFKKAVPEQWDVLGVSKEYVYLVEFIYTMRELQDILIKMAEALREI
jgi:uncharacterized membrane protein YccC